ncbi:MAG TPA: hypothetical protein VNZ64_23430 [Candidatus Acidoferrum sp.]|jgi:hypothetical protein|nr:hypothetical protein [Candidatus Acidoferrum sp.]
MKPNPGGQLAPENIVGREALIVGMWEILEGRSIYMNDLRRVGKTMILRKMEAHPPKGWLTIKRDLGGCHTAAEFATQAYRDSAELLTGKKRAMRRMEQLLGALRGAEIAGVLKLPGGSPAPWKEVLTRTFTDLNEEMDKAGNHIVFLWDEVPFLLDNISKREGSATAMEILDVLRSLSQDYARVRLVLTGSVGLHHVLTSLRGEGYLNSPLNHMERVAPGPLAPADAAQLALDLLRGARLDCAEPGACAKAAAEAVGNVAFYIHKLLSRLPPRQPITPALIEAILQTELAHPDNDWDLAHYRTRLPLYYGKNEGLVLLALDAVAASDAPIPFEVLRRQLSSQTPLAKPERLRGVLKLLQQDHYLDRDPDGGYRYRFPLIRRWWRFDRSL